MRFRKALTIGTTLIAFTAVTGCGSNDDKGENSGSESPAASSSGSTGQDAGGGLPKAADLASIAYYVNKYTSCLDLKTGADYDVNHDGDRTAWGADEAADPSWGIKERGVCSDGSGAPVALLSVADMKKFQTAAKANNDKFLVGQDFAVIPVGSQAIQELQKSELLFLTCDPDFSAPSGFQKSPALVDGCALSNYFGD
ncbi:hypothetical protein [Streptomyces soliscabiei]|uniref:hypothetical protein n=1 Tax=Streptomyces soliscabiei TaxID=588897 RepID=UPI0029B24304|nr:hypothetical protein [Streptomyces sp. NY05-11A]MDX2679446.1 hypothetical protein [Streptomyces sp. NY05-11A]